MPLYVCAECNTVENTALGSYYADRHAGRPPRCSQCATGEWHGRFPRREYDPEADGDIRNRPEAA